MFSCVVSTLILSLAVYAKRPNPTQSIPDATKSHKLSTCSRASPTAGPSTGLIRRDARLKHLKRALAAGINFGIALEAAIANKANIDISQDSANEKEMDSRYKQPPLVRVKKRDIEDVDDGLVSLADAFGPEEDVQTSQNMDPVDVSATVRFKSLAARYYQIFLAAIGPETDESIQTMDPAAMRLKTIGRVILACLDGYFFFYFLYSIIPMVLN
jgi:hypothetical protein